jgi:hypothetical protein
MMKRRRLCCGLQVHRAASEVDIEPIQQRKCPQNRCPPAGSEAEPSNAASLMDAASMQQPVREIASMM